MRWWSATAGWKASDRWFANVRRGRGPTGLGERVVTMTSVHPGPCCDERRRERCELPGTTRGPPGGGPLAVSEGGDPVTRTGLPPVRRAVTRGGLVGRLR